MSLIDPGCGPSPAPGPAFRVTNTGTEALTYTITFTLLNGSGEAMDAVRQTVASVGPGQGVTRTVEGAATTPGAGPAGADRQGAGRSRRRGAPTRPARARRPGSGSRTTRVTPPWDCASSGSG
ncbi:hypothetical protein ACFSNO_11400 [Streptomyces cirratus]